jgi:hypothetical protein
VLALRNARFVSGPGWMLKIVRRSKFCSRGHHTAGGIKYHEADADLGNGLVSTTSAPTMTFSPSASANGRA